MPGVKKALNIKEAKPILIEHYRELSTVMALREFKNTAEIWKFVPDHWASRKSKKSQVLVVAARHDGAGVDQAGRAARARRSQS
jgi:hypothetical protein